MEKILLGKKDVAAMLGVSPRTLERYIKDGLFPRGKIFVGRTVWSQDIVQKWVKNLFGK